MYSKQNKLSIFQGNTIKTEVIEIKRVIQLPGLGLEKNAGGKNEGFSHYVIENKQRQISETCLAIISMKTMHIEDACHYIDENKGSYRD
jgi:hypothetical protein